MLDYDDTDNTRIQPNNITNISKHPPIYKYKYLWTCTTLEQGAR